MQKEILVENEEGPHGEFLLDLAHDGVKLVARLVEVDELSLAPEEGRRGAEVTAHGAAHGGDQDGRRARRLLRQVDAQEPGAEARVDHGVPDGGLLVLPEKSPEPRNPVALHDVVGIDDPVEILAARDVPADDDGCAGPVLADQLAHLFHLARVRHDGADPHDVVVVLPYFPDKIVEAGIIEDGAGRVDIGLQHPQRKRGVKHPKGEPSLDARHLVLVELHGVDLAASVFVILRIGPEDAGEQDPRPAAQGMGDL